MLQTQQAGAGHRDGLEQAGTVSEKQHGQAAQKAKAAKAVEFPRLDRRAIAAQADRLSERYTAPPIPVLEIIEDEVGIDVIFADFGQDSDAFAGLCDFANRSIYVNDDIGFERKLFTMAHELGHWVLHKQFFDGNPRQYPALPRLKSTNTGNPLQQQANAFAANLLVPERLLRPVMGATVAALAGVFCVSITMMEDRRRDVSS